MLAHDALSNRASFRIHHVMSANIPESIGKYIVEKQLGRGAMGEVYLCSQPIVDRKVAVKRVQSSALDNPELLERFLREASAAGNLHHENIVVVYTVEEDEAGTPFIVMEYLDGVDLGDMLADPDGLPRLRQRLEVAFQVASALDHAHQNSVVHRDVKPSNVIVLSGGRVKLVDFGIARIGGSKMTLDGSLMGTPQYMPPEQWEGKPTDGRSDIYAFGILLYELAAGHVPYDSENPLAIGTKILDKSNPPLGVSELFDGSAPPDGINEVIAACTAREPDDRPPSFAEVRVQLGKLLASLPEQDSFESMAAEQVDARITRAREQLERGQYKRAAANLSRARREAKGTIEGITELENQVEVVRLCTQAADALESSDLAEATKKLERALALDPDSAMASRLGVRIDRTRKVNELVERARTARQAMDFERVLSTCDRILEVDPEHGFALRLSAEAQELERTRQLNDRTAQARELAGDDLGSALAAVEAILAEDPSHAEAELLRSELESKVALQDASDQSPATGDDATVLSPGDDATILVESAGAAEDATILASPGEDATILASPGEDATLLHTGPSPAQTDESAEPATPAEKGGKTESRRGSKKGDKPKATVAEASSTAGTATESKQKPKKTVTDRRAPATVAERSGADSTSTVAPVGILVGVATVIVVAVAAWVFWPSAEQGAEGPVPAVVADGSLHVTASTAAVVSIESVADGVLNLDPADDGCPGLACPPFAVPLPPGDYIVRWRSLAADADAWIDEERISIAEGQTATVFWERPIPTDLFEPDR
ncbi:MAG: protein kinase [Acidobacteria bacterium]|nr:protein kinase [Acidobacteriota bacterium]